MQLEHEECPLNQEYCEGYGHPGSLDNVALVKMSVILHAPCYLKRSVYEFLKTIER